MCYNKDRKEVKKMFDFYFTDEVTGEDFLVECDTFREAKIIAYENFEEPHFIEKLTVEQGEALGLDTY